MFCPNCGTKLTDNDRFCPNCGTKNAAAPEAVLPQPFAPETSAPQNFSPENPAPADPVRAAEGLPAPEQPVVQAKRSILKPLLVALGGLALIAVIIFGIVKLVGGKKSSDNEVVRAAEDSVSMLKDYLGELPNLGRVIDNLDRISDNRSAEGTLSFRAEFEEMPVEGSLTFRTDTGDKKVITDISVKLGQVGEPITATIYADEEKLVLAGESLFGKDEGISLSLKDLGSKWNGSGLAEMTGLQLPEDLSPDLFGMIDRDYEAIMTDAFGEQWTKFEKTLKLQPVTGEPHFTDGTAREVVWDSGLLQQMYEQSQQLDESVSGSEGYYGSSASSLLFSNALSKAGTKQLAYRIVEALWEADQSGIRIEVRLDDDDRITGVYLRDSERSGEEILLAGEKNPWERIVLTSDHTYTYHDQEFRRIEETEITFRMSGSQLTAAISEKVRDTEYEGRYDYDEMLAVIVYNDATGEITAVDGDGSDLLDGVRISLKPDGRQTVLHVGRYERLGSEEEAFDLTIGPFSGSIKVPASNLRELLELDQTGLQSLIMEVYAKLLPLIPGDYTPSN